MRNEIKGRGLTGVAMSMLLLCVGAVRAAAPAVLDEVPADAPMVVIVPSLSKMNEGVRMMTNTLGLQVPEMADVLKQFKAQTGMEQGIDDEGSLALVLLDAGLGIDAAKQGGEPPLVLLVPVTDYAAFMKNFKAQPAAGVTEVEMPNAGGPGFVKQQGKYAVLSPAKELVEGFAAGKAAGAMSKSVGVWGDRCMSGSLVFAYVNAQVVAPVLSPKIDQGMTEMEQAMAGDPNAAMVKDVMALYTQAGKAVLRDAEGLVAGMSIDELGVRMDQAIQFKADSPTAKLLGNSGPAKAMLDRLPDEPYLMAMGADLSGVDMVALLTPMVDAMEKLPNLGAMMGAMRPYLKVMSQASGMAQVIPIPQNMQLGAGNPFAALSIIRSADAPAMLEANMAAINAMNGLKIAMPDLGEAAAISYTTQYFPKALEIDGTPVDQYSVMFNLPPEMMQNNPAGPMLAMMGMTGQSGYVAASGNYMVMTATPDAGAIRGLLNATTQDKGLGSQMLLEQVRGQLTPEPMMEYYLSFSGAVKMVNGFAAMFLPAPLQAPDDLPPVAMSISCKDGGVAGRFYVPLSVIKAGKDIFDQVQGAMNQQGGGPAQDAPPADDDGAKSPPPAPF